MPFAALALNITWEIFNTYKGIEIVGFYHISTIFDALWFFLDIGILTTYLLYSSRKQKVKPWLFYFESTVMIITCMGFQWYCYRLLGAIPGALYSSGLMNFIMSILFIKLLYRRKNCKGQSLSIGINKAIGSLAASILVGGIGVNQLGGAYRVLLLLGGITFCIDCYYIYLLCQRSKSTLRLRYFCKQLR